MSQVATKKKLQIRNERVKVSAYFHEQGSVLKGDAEGYCDHFEIEVVVDSDAPEKEIQKLIDDTMETIESWGKQKENELLQI